ncbi:MAG: Tetratricopeptide repeat protein [Acidobacteriaceae bacterium]|nr:Tetratricopeptide repeat protein [Acidobacteriaceae bacterium]
MGVRRRSKPRIAFPLAVLCLCGVIAAAQVSTSRTVRKHRVAVDDTSVAPAVAEAESALEKQDYARAENLLLPVVELDPKDYRAWFDLAYVYNATDRRSDAITSYRKSLAIKPDVFAANLNLGLLLAATGNNNDEAAKYLLAATQLKPESKPAESLTRTWIALGRVLTSAKPADAANAFRKAAELSSKDVEPHLLAAAVLEKQNDFSGAESEYKSALALDLHSSSARDGLVRLYVNANRLPEAESMLREHLKQNPSDAAAHLQLGRLLSKSGNAAAAAEEFEAGLKASPNDPQLLHEVAATEAAAKKYDDAAVRYQQLVQANPKDARLHHEYGTVLLHQHKSAEAQDQLLKALELDKTILDAYGDLALAASENKDYRLTIGVLDSRAKLAQETPATYFLRATAYDNLKAFEQASENYRQFLATSNGEFPDREWQARHRLIAIEPTGSKKKK